MTDAIRYETGPDRIVVLTLDSPGQSANTMNALYRQAMAACVERLLAEKNSIAGVIITSAKRTFSAGCDFNELINVDKTRAQVFYDAVLELKTQLRALETLGKPVVAAINGAALGGGWEICLACHHRVALDQPSVQIGLPEVTFGLLPGGGGVVRMVRLLGLEKALPYLLEGQKVSARQAQQAGLIEDLAEDREQLLAKARTWILANPCVAQPWDVKGYRIPGGTPSDPGVASMLAIAPSILRNKTQGCLPAPEKILCAAVEGAQVDFDIAHLIETRYFTELATSQVAKNLMGTFWFQLNEIKAGGAHSQGLASWEIIKGAGTNEASDSVLQINETPIVLNDRPGSFSSRVLGAYTHEGIAMLGEGVSAPMIETEARKAGMRGGPLAISDEISLSLMSHIRAQTAKDLQVEGKTPIEHPAFTVIDWLLECQRPGKAAGGGFYEYLADGQKHLWPPLRRRFEKADGQISPQDIRDRLLFVQALETVRCLEEGLLVSTADANVGSIFGIGFATWTGGALQFINQYGLRDFVARVQYLAEQYGERFSPPALLLEKAARQVLF
ncbi:enoyl-CoA hydratase-related protein [Pseudomonas citri]|uniref:enoyl-CoA hydratase-related protein n=1 Tax=Pseudomonas citri TaxID=2978349 RepID=UPI0021B62175|nr:enoyl-CoA hydratase-related protein [Pseudomonas citri]